MVEAKSRPEGKRARALEHVRLVCTPSNLISLEQIPPQPNPPTPAYLIFNRSERIEWLCEILNSRYTVHDLI